LLRGRRLAERITRHRRGQRGATRQKGSAVEKTIPGGDFKIIERGSRLLV
jgi:hypothetical protein